ncbi:MAG: DUF4340 domain-containing protein [Verrucomicrobiales bacterium]|nr:DUF4340 domain-containing protein [Verrucomicrobiales bacterium]
MGTKTLIRLLIALAVIGGIAAILHFSGTGSGVSEVASSTTKKKVFSDFPLNDVAKVVIRDKEGEVDLVKGEESWEVTQRDGYPADEVPIVALLKYVWDLNIGRPVTIGRSQYGRLDLIHPDEAKETDKAATILTFQDSEGKDLASLWLGKVFERSENRPSPIGGMATTDAGRYVKTGSSNSVYLVGGTFDDVKLDPSEWIDKTFFKVENLETIEIKSGEKADDWKLVRKEPSGDFEFAKTADGEELDQTKVSSMKTAFSNPQIEDVFTGEAKKENTPDKTTFVITTFDGFRYEIQVGEKNDLNELPLSLKVSGKFQEKREPGEEESDEEKEKLDEQFEERLQERKDKLATQKKLEGHIFKVRSYIVDSITKKRSELLVEEEQEASTGSGEEIAPGVTLPGIPNP